MSRADFFYKVRAIKHLCNDYILTEETADTEDKKRMRVLQKEVADRLLKYRNPPLDLYIWCKGIKKAHVAKRLSKDEV